MRDSVQKKRELMMQTKANEAMKRFEDRHTDQAHSQAIANGPDNILHDK